MSAVRCGSKSAWIVICLGLLTPVTQAEKVVFYDVASGVPPVGAPSSEAFAFFTWDSLGKDPTLQDISTTTQGNVRAARLSANPALGEADAIEDGFRRQESLEPNLEVNPLMEAPGLALKMRAWVNPNASAHQFQDPTNDTYTFDGRVRKSFAGDTITGAAMEFGTNGDYPADGNASGQHRGYRLMLTVNPDDGDPIAMISVPEANSDNLPTFEVEGGAGDFHDYELQVFPSNRDLQHLLVNGENVLSFEGPTSSPDPNTARIGDCCTGAPSIDWAITVASWETIEDVFVPRAGDANGDKSVDTQDIIQLLAEAKYETGQPATFAQGDFDGNGVFDSTDIVRILAESLFETGPYAASAQSVPEPSSIGLPVLGALLALSAVGRRPRGG